MSVKFTSYVRCLAACDQWLLRNRLLRFDAALQLQQQQQWQADYRCGHRHGWGLAVTDRWLAVIRCGCRPAASCDWLPGTVGGWVLVRRCVSAAAWRYFGRASGWYGLRQRCDRWTDQAGELLALSYSTLHTASISSVSASSIHHLNDLRRFLCLARLSDSWVSVLVEAATGYVFVSVARTTSQRGHTKWRHVPQQATGESVISLNFTRHLSISSYGQWHQLKV